jgi:hypothetical protein
LRPGQETVECLYRIWLSGIRKAGFDAKPSAQRFPPIMMRPANRMTEGNV